MSTVAVVKCASYDEEEVDAAVAEAVELGGGLESLLARGSTVLLKPNLLEVRDGESGATTDRRVVGALVKMIRARGACALVGDSPGLRHRGAGDTVLDVTGMRAHCEELGAAVESFESARLTDTSIAGGIVLKRAVVAAAAVESDLVISIPKLKTHSLTVMTGAVKNLYGVLPGGQKTLGHVLGRTHAEFADVLCDLYSLVRPRFAVMDAVTGMSGTWRTQKDRIRPGLILASADAVALDAVACELAGLSPMDVPTLRQAHERGLGVADPALIEVVGETSARIEDFTLPYRTSIAWRLLRLFAPALQKEDPRVVPELCDGCRACEDACPAHAIGYPDGRAQIDLEGCIRCFCCLELCPRRAVEIERGWLGKRLFGGR